MHLVPRNICCCNLIPLLGISSLSLTFNLVSVGVTFQGISQGNPVCWKISSQPTKQGSHCICHLDKLLSGKICNLKINKNPFSRPWKISLQKISPKYLRSVKKSCVMQRTRNLPEIPFLLTFFPTLNQNNGATRHLMSVSKKSGQTTVVIQYYSFSSFFWNGHYTQETKNSEA